MVQLPHSPKELPLVICCLLTGAACIAVGVHYSFANIGPQQAAAQARKDYIRARFKKFLQDNKSDSQQ